MQVNSIRLKCWGKDMKETIHIGTYTSGGTSQGIYSTQFDTQTGMLGEVRLIIPQREPSYLAVSDDGKRLYAVEENVPHGRVFSYVLTEQGWKQTGCQSSGGSAPCHVLLDEASGLLSVANYMDGAVSFYDLPPDGALNQPPRTTHLKGHGPHPRQECSHAHQCIKYEDQILVCDLGTDSVRLFGRAQDGWQEARRAFAVTQPGAGPRHGVFTADGEMFYLLCELSNGLYAYQKTADGFQAVDVYDYLPNGVHNASAAALRLSSDERFLFVSSRGGFDGVALFALDAQDRLPSLCCVYPTRKCPRDILPVGDYLLCACQDQNVVQVMRLDREQKVLELVGETSVPRPVCLMHG